MAERLRKNRIEFYVSDEEKQLIKRKMEMLKTKNIGAYLRKIAVDGYIIPEKYRMAISSRLFYCRYRIRGVGTLLVDAGLKLPIRTVKAA